MQFKTNRRGVTVHGYHNFRDTSIFLDSPSFYLRLRSKTYRLGIHQMKANLTVQEESPRTLPVHVRHQRYNKNSETRIQSKAVPTFHTLRIGWHTRFQSSSPCSIIHTVETHRYKQTIIVSSNCYFSTNQISERCHMTTVNRIVSHPFIATVDRSFVLV